MISAIIQARMNSVRLPGKVMKKIFGKAVLELLVERLRYCKSLDDIIIATTTNAADDAIWNLAQNLAVKSMRGSEDDVLGRYYEAAKIFKIDHIVRITADSPLMDPHVVDMMIDTYKSDHFKYDYVTNTLTPTFPSGLDMEIFSLKTLEKINRFSDKRYQREHVSVYIIENPNQFVIKNVLNDKDLSGFRWTLDRAEDFELIKIIYENIYPKKRYFLWMIY
jgi:spore coat polysaccharide biosynthesis protein SpsF